MAVVRGAADTGSPFASAAALSARQQPRRRRLDVAFDAGHLAGKKQRRVRADLPCLGEHRRAVHVGVAMHHAEADELGLLQPGDHPKHARLIAPFDLRLEPDEAEVIARQIVLPQLHGGVRLAAGARIDQPDRLHRPEPQRVAPAMRHHLDRQAAFEEPLLVEVVDGRRFGRDQRVVEALVLVARQRTVQIIALAVVDAAGGTGYQAPGTGAPRAVASGSRTARLLSHRDARNTFDAIDRLGQHDRADRVVEIQMIAADDRARCRRTAPPTSADRSRRSPARARSTAGLAATSSRTIVIERMVGERAR